jgi:hypothetical protein
VCENRLSSIPVLLFLKIKRSSKRLSLVNPPGEDFSSSEDSASWSDEEGEDPSTPTSAWLAADKQWSKACLNKHVYFRWSTAFNSKNKFRGIVTEHRSRVERSRNNERLDFLVIKVFGSTEDRYRMGKDIRELYVLPNKTSLMMTGSDDELRSRAIRRWTWKEGWVERTDSEKGVESTQAETPVVPSKGPVIVKAKKEEKLKSKVNLMKRAVRKLEAKKTQFMFSDSVTNTMMGGKLTSVHSRKSMAGQIRGFSFWFLDN